VPRLTGGSIRIRGTRVGASEVAALLECGHPFVTPGAIYARIVHGLMREGSDLMSLGSDLEPAILHLGAERLGIKVRASAHTYTHPVVPLAATPDALVLGAPELVEVKLVTHWGAADFWSDGPPPHVLAQAQTQLLLTHRERCHVVALLSGERLGVWTVDADPDEQAAIVAAVAKFAMEHLQPKVPPPDIGPEFALTVYAPTGTVNATASTLDAGDELADLYAAKADIEKRTDKLRGRLIMDMVHLNAAVLVAPGWTAKVQTSPSGRGNLVFRRKP